MCQPNRWWQGLVPLAILWLLAMWFNTRAVERDLTTKGSEALKTVMLDTPTIRLSGRDATVAADAFTVDGQHAAITAVEATKGVRRVTDATKLVPEMRPYAWAVRRNGNKLTITGNAPSPDVRTQILDAATKAVPNGEVVDQMAWARGAPASFAALTAFELGELGKLAVGSANLTDGQIAIAGDAASSDAYGQVISDLSKLPEGATLGTVAINPPEARPYIWAARRDANKVILSGNAANPAVRTSLGEAAKKAFPGTEVVDQMAWGRGAPSDFSAISGFLLAQLAKLSSGKVSLSDNQISIEGQAPNSSAYEQVLTDLKTAPAGAAVVGTNVLPPEAKPYLWSLARDGRNVIVSGNIGTPEARAQLLQSVKKAVPDAEISDQLTYARGAPAAFADLSSFALSVLAKLGKGAVRYSDQSLAIEGEAPSATAYEEVLAELTKLPDGATLTNADILPPVATPFSLTASREDGALTLSGNVPSGDARAQLLDLAKKTVPNVVDHLTFARGAPANFGAATAFGLAEIGRLSSGSFALIDNQISISGEAATSAAFEQATADLNKLPNGAILAKADILPPEVRPYTWTAARDGETLTLSGNVPSADIRAQMVDTAKNSVSRAKVVDHLTFARGAPANFGAVTSFDLAEIGRLSSGSVALVDNQISISGEAATSAAFEQAIADLNKLPAGATLAKADILPPEARPYAWTANRDGETLTLSGNVPSVDVRTQILDAAKAIPGAKVIDHLTFARGAPANFGTATAFGLAQIGRLSSGSVALVDNQISVSGEAATSAAFEQAIADLNKLPAGETLAQADILPPEARPYTWTANRDGETLALSGNVPSVDVRAQIVDAAKAIPGAKVIDHLTFARGAPANFGTATSFGLAEIGRLSSGSVALVDNQISISGEAATSAAFEQAIADLNKSPGGATLAKADILPPEAKPYTWTAARDGETLTLSGNVPSVDVRTQIVDAAKAISGAKVVDHLTFARGAPANFGAATSFGLAEIGRLSSGSVALLDNQISISGEAATSAPFEQAITDLNKLPAGATLGKTEILPPEAKPYTWTAARDGETVILSGNVPSIDVRTQIVDAAKAISGAQAVDHLNYARGAPANFGEAASFGLAEIGRLSSGSVALVDNQISISGEAASSAAFEQAIADLNELPAGATLAKADILPPEAKPYTWTAARDGETLTLSGNIPSVDVRTQIVEAAKAISGAKVIDHLTFARGAAANFGAATSFGLAEIGRLSSGSVALLDNQISISGEAATSAAFEQIIADLNKLPAGATLGKADILPPEAKPYTWTAARDGETLTLSGNVPNVDVRTQIGDAAKAISGANIIDRLNYARGAPAAFAAIAGYGLTEIGKVPKGVITLKDNEVSFSGEAPTGAVYEQILADLTKLPAGAVLAKADIDPPLAKPFDWSARRDGNVVTLAGNVPTTEVRTQLLEAAKKVAGAKVTDQMGIARGAPANFATISTFALSALGDLIKGAVSITDDKLSVEGEATTSGGYDQVTTALNTLPNNTTLSKAAILPPLAETYAWSAKREGSSLTISGDVPSPETRASLVDLARKLFGGANIDDQMTYASGAPKNWNSAAEIGLQQLARMKEGEANLVGTNFSLSGAVSDAAARNAVEEAIHALPSGFAITTEALTAPEPSSPQPPAAEPLQPPGAETAPPPATAMPTKPEASFKAVREAGALTLSGSYPDERAHEDIVDAAQRKFFAEIIVDQLQQNDELRRPTASAALAGLEKLSRLASGSVVIVGNVVRLSGAALYDKAADQIQSASRDALPAGFQFQTDLTVQPPEVVTADACQKLFVDLVSRGKVRFETGKAAIHRDSFGLLDFAVYNALRCPSGNIEISGHTDSDGTKDSNLDLSKKRAQAVVEYLIKAGIDPQRLSSTGYGDARPVASNYTEEGKAENRRIEFSVK